MMYAPFPTLTAAVQAGQFVAERIAEGSDYLKIISGTGGLWPSLDPETIQALVSAAHARGLIAVAHASSTAGVEEVVAAGVDVVAHVPANAEPDKAGPGAWPKPESWSARRWPPSRTPSANRVARQWPGTRGSPKRSATPGHACGFGCPPMAWR